MLKPTEENTVEITPKELRELANTLERQVKTSTGDIFVWFNDKILFKYPQSLRIHNETKTEEC